MSENTEGWTNPQSSQISEGPSQTENLIAHKQPEFQDLQGYQ